MKSTVIGIWLLLVLPACAADTNRLTRGDGNILFRLADASPSQYPLLIGRQDNDTPVRIMESLESDTLRELFPRHKVYRLISTRDPIHGASFSALLLDTNGVPTHLESDKEVADFLGSLAVRRDVGSTSNALKLVRAFAELRSYKIVESAPDFKDARESEKQPALLASDFKFFAEDRKGEWRVYATLFTSEYSGSYERYIFAIYKKPGAGFYFSEPVLIRLRNYVY
jgi:hypothetical protein